MQWFKFSQGPRQKEITKKKQKDRLKERPVPPSIGIRSPSNDFQGPYSWFTSPQGDQWADNPSNLDGKENMVPWSVSEEGITPLVYYHGPMM